MKKYLIVVLMFILIGCSEDPTSIGEEFLDKNINYYADTLAPEVLLSYIFETNTNTSDILFIGKYDNITDASLLIKFQMPNVDSIAGRVTKLKVLKAEILLYPLYIIGTKNFNFEVQTINKFWDYTKNNSQIISDITPNMSNNILFNSTVNDSLITLLIDTNVVSNWMKAVFYDTTLKNYGIRISSTTNNAILAINGYSPYTNTKLTSLKVTYYDIEKKKEFTFTVWPSVDLSVFKGNLPDFDANKYTLAQGGFTIATKVLFNFPTKFYKSVINKAILSFDIDTILSTKNFSDTIYVSLLSNENGDEVYGGAYTIYKAGKKGHYEGSIVPLMQALSNNNVSNYGLKLFYGRNINSIDKVYFKKESIKLILGFTQLK